MKKIAVTGSHGLIGSALVPFLEKRGYAVVRIVRSTANDPAPGSTVEWNIEQGRIQGDGLNNCEAVVHLAGANIANARWTAQYKRMILDSRVKSTRLLARALAELRDPPKVFICASAVGYYGNHALGISVDENTPAADDFLAQVCRQWEEAAAPLKEKGIRVAHLRMGVVLSRAGGALAKMLPAFQLGLGGTLGNGSQIMSWVALDEVPAVVEHIVQDPKISGGVNVVSPRSVSNREFTRVLGEVLHRPTVFPVPGFALRLVLGEMADALLLGGARVVPKKLTDAGYSFRCPDLKTALEKSP